MYQITKIVVGAAVLAASAIAIPASSAMASGATTHTFKVISHATTNKLWQQEPSFAFTNVDRDAATGAKVGLDIIDCAPNLSTHKVSCDVTFALRGGLLHGKVNFSSGSNTGTITGGTRAFQHVTGGTITAVPAGHDELVTVTYHS